MVLIFLALVSAVLATTNGCKGGTVIESGFSADFYEYPLLLDTLPDGTSPGMDGFKASYWKSDYRNLRKLGSATGIFDLNIQDPDAHLGPDGKGIEEPVFGVLVPSTNFAVELTGYFYPEESGTYTFFLVANDAVGLQLGRGQESNCCEDDFSDIVTEEFAFAPVFVSAETLRASFTLIAGNYYPIRVIFFNAWQDYELHFHLTTPDGETHSDVGQYVRRLLFTDVCDGSSRIGVTTTVTSTWTGTYTTTTLEGEYDDNTLIIEVPKPTVTTISTWTGPGTETSFLFFFFFFS